MTLDAVTDIFAFVLAEGSFTESILFAENAPSELTQEERKDIDAVLGHVEQSYVGLLSACRAELIAAAAAEGDPVSKILEGSWNRPRTIWERGRVSLPVLVKQSWNAWVTIGLWARAREPKEPIGLHGHLTVQERHAEHLAQACGARAAQLNADGTNFATTPIQPKEGDQFQQLGRQLAAELWPVVRDLRRLLINANAPSAGGITGT